jgi:hypothetical protein
MIQQGKFDSLESQRTNLEECALAFPDLLDRLAVTTFDFCRIPTRHLLLHVRPEIACADLLKAQTPLPKGLKLSQLTQSSTVHFLPQTASVLDVGTDQEVIPVELVEFADRVVQIMVRATVFILVIRLAREHETL